MTTIIHDVRAFALALALAGATAGAAQAQHAESARTTGALFIAGEQPGDSIYHLGRQAIIDGDYRRGADLLKQVVDKYPSATNAGDALYWRAWALHRLGVDRRSTKDLDDAIVALDRQTKQYPKAATLTDARSLRGTIRSAQASLGDATAASSIATEAKVLRQQPSCTGSKADEEMRLAALEGLMSMNADDAIPILKDVLKQRDACRIEMRKKAIFLIAQKRAGDVVPTLLDAARNDPSADVRHDAVYWLSASRGDQAIPALDSILFQSRDDELRKAAVFALSQQHGEGARKAMQRAAEDERMPAELRGEVVFWLGQTKGADLEFFKGLFKKTHDVELKNKIMSSVGQGAGPDASGWLADVANDKAVDTETRKSAIFSLSQRRTATLDQLQSIYDRAKGDDEIQGQVIFAYTQRSEPGAVDRLMTIAKSDAAIEMRKQALFWLGQKNDPRVKQFLRDLLK